MKQRHIDSACAVLAAFLCAAGALAQQPGYPVKPIRIIVPYAPGGGADVVARVISQKLGETFAQSIVVDNRAGGGGTIGSETAVRATPDGYTLAFVSGAYTTMAAVHKLPYDPVKDVTPIVLVGEASSIAVVHPSVPVKSIKELVAYAKANPGKLNYGSGGTGGFSHLLVGLFELMANVRMTHIPYKGTGPALTDLLGGQLQVIFGSTPSTAPHVKSGRLRALGVTSKERSSALPDVPPIAETSPRLLRTAALRDVGAQGPAGRSGRAVEPRSSQAHTDAGHGRPFITSRNRCGRRPALPNFAMLCATISDAGRKS